MMKSALVSVICLFLCAAPAAAEEIKVVNPDGSVSTLAVPKRAAPPAAMRSPVFRQPGARTPPATSPMVRAPQSKKAAATPKAEMPQKAAPVKKKVVKAAPRPKAKPKETPAAEEVAVLATLPVKAKPALVPDNVPLKPESMGRVVGKEKKQVAKPQGPVTAAVATRIALEVAPPARGYEVTQRTYKDRPAFMVTFKTENGPHDILVDAQTGELLKR